MIMNHDHESWSCWSIISWTVTILETYKSVRLVGCYNNTVCYSTSWDFDILLPSVNTVFEQNGNCKKRGLFWLQKTWIKCQPLLEAQKSKASAKQESTAARTSGENEGTSCISLSQCFLVGCQPPKIKQLFGPSLKWLTVVYRDVLDLHAMNWSQWTRLKTLLTANLNDEPDGSNCGVAWPQVLGFMKFTTNRNTI